MSFTETGGFGLFYYPPTFAPLLLPFACCRSRRGDLGLDRAIAWPRSWRASRSCRSRGRSAGGSLLLAGLSFPFVYAVKLGQVGPLLFLAVRRRLALARRPDPTRRERRARGRDQAAAGPRPRLGAAHRSIPAAVIGRRGILVALAIVATLLAGPSRVVGLRRR